MTEDERSAGLFRVVLDVRSHFAERETIGGIPLGLSRDFALLPPAGEPFWAHCPHCVKNYVDVWRLAWDGCRTRGGMCEACREEGRERWIAAKAAEPLAVPRAVATYRGGSR